MNPGSKSNQTQREEVHQGNSWIVLACPFLLALLAWGVILCSFAFHQTGFIDHDFLIRTSHWPWIIALAVFLLSWQVMTLAMMLPSLFPLLAGVGSMAQSSRQLWTMQVLFIVGYASAWTLFALSAFLGDSLLHWIATYWRWLATHPWVIGTTALAVAGIFQCSSFKQRCLRQCGQLSRWFPQGQGRDSIWCMGAGYGLSCMGSCWALMLVTFGLGMKSPLAMALLTGIIIAEKEFRCRYRFSYTIGSLFLVLALLWGMFPAGLLSI